MTHGAFGLPRLGFGLMRLPTTAGARIDMDQTIKMVDRFIEQGFSYFDTAWGYLNGLSEVVVRDAIASRHPRSAFQLADKFPIWVAETQSDVRRIFETQLARTGAEYFDYYLAHALNASYLKKMDELNVWAFMAAQKAAGRIKHIGFSFHDSAEVLKGILDAHPEVEFVQLQINYVDWDSAAIQSRLCYEACTRRGLPVIVMEPVKGGLLATPPEAARAVLESANPHDSPARWALRYVAELRNVAMILSGMSDMAQVEDNMATISQFVPFDARERTALGEAHAIIEGIPTVGCTGCGYCLEGCPKSIAIPSVIEAHNAALTYGPTATVKRLYFFASAASDPASCVRCGACQATCPQHLPIEDTLAKAASALGGKN